MVSENCLRSEREMGIKSMSSLPNCRIRTLPLTVLTLLALICLSGSALSQDKPVWRFSILASIDDAFVEQFGGMEKCDSLIRFQLDSVNHMFNDPGVFDGIFDFYLDSLQSFSQNGLVQAQTPHPDQDYHIVYDFDKKTLSNWVYPPYNAVLFRTYSTEKIPFPFFTPGHILLTHELAHSRGAVDLYGLEVAGMFNEVNGISFTMPGGYMSDLMSQVWTEYTTRVINRNGGDILSLDRFNLAIFPERMYIRVVDSSENPIPDAEVSIYGHPWYGQALSEDLRAIGVTDSDGCYVLREEVFIGLGIEDKCPNILCIKFPTLLVKAEHDGNVKYLWLPFTEPQVHALRGDPSPFIATITMSSGRGGSVGPALVPDDFTLDQNFPNPFNSRTSICVTLPAQGRLRLEISNILGQTEAVLYDGSAPEGESCYTWDGDASSGVYLCRATYGNFTHAVKMLLLK